MKRKYFHSKNDNSIYYEGRDQKNRLNLINMKSGSEYFLPNHYTEETEKVNENFYEISKERALREIPEPYGNHD